MIYIKQGLGKVKIFYGSKQHPVSLSLNSKIKGKEKNIKSNGRLNNSGVPEQYNVELYIEEIETFRGFLGSPSFTGLEPDTERIKGI